MTLHADAALLFGEDRPPDLVTVEQGHGRRERWAIRVSAELAGFSAFPGPRRVAEVRPRVVVPATGAATEQRRHLATSLGPEDAGPAARRRQSREHRGVENELAWVKDDGWGGDRRVVHRHARGELVGPLRPAARNLPRSRCPLWLPAAALMARAEWVSGHPSAILAGLCSGPYPQSRRVEGVRRRVLSSMRQRGVAQPG